MERMTAAHGSMVLDILNDYILHGQATFMVEPLPNTCFPKFFAMTNGLPACVETSHGQVIGFGMLKPFGPTSLFGGTAEISYYVAKGYTRKGIGSGILSWLEQEGAKCGITRLIASVRDQNLPSMAFHRKNGFQCCGKFLQIGDDHGQPFDLYWFQKTIKKEA